MKKCELCESPAKMYCESDQASLCWDCDTKVHGANFLVAKHTRTLLCHVCQSLTPWNGSGPKLGPTISVCNVCVGNSSGCRDNGINGETQNSEDEDSEEEDDDEDKDEDDDDGDESSDDDEENQVVPWSSTPPPPLSSSSTFDQEFSSKFCNGKEGVSESQIAFSMKRMREATKFHSQVYEKKEPIRLLKDQKISAIMAAAGLKIMIINYKQLLEIASAMIRSIQGQHVQANFKE